MFSGEGSEEEEGGSGVRPLLPLLQSLLAPTSRVILTSYLEYASEERVNSSSIVFKMYVTSTARGLTSEQERSETTSKSFLVLEAKQRVKKFW